MLEVDDSVFYSPSLKKDTLSEFKNRTVSLIGFQGNERMILRSFLSSFGLIVSFSPSNKSVKNIYAEPNLITEFSNSVGVDFITDLFQISNSFIDDLIFEPKNHSMADFNLSQFEEFSQVILNERTVDDGFRKIKRKNVSFF